jgi:hypothetical protein
MMNVGPTELLIVLMILVGGCGLPVILLAGLYLLYDRLKKIERRLDDLQARREN